MNLRRRERIKPELHRSYRHLCNPSIAITSQLFRDDLTKAAKGIAEADRISSKIHGDRRSADRREKRQRSRHFAGFNSRTPYRSNYYYTSKSKNYHRLCTIYDVIVHCMTEEYYGCRGTHGLVCVAFNRMCCATYWFNPNILLHEKHYNWRRG